MKTINAAFQETVAKCGGKMALMFKPDSKQPYQSIPYGELAQRVERMASGLAALGVERGDRVALLSENRPEWAIADLAALSLGAVTVPIYPTVPAPQIAYVVKNSGAKALVVSDSKQLKKAMEARKDAPDLKHLIAMDPGPLSEDANIHTFAWVLEQGEKTPLGAEKLVQIRQSVQPDDVASIVYTSGTTGDPKGAMLTHGNIASNVDAALEHFRRQGAEVTQDDVFLSFLPLSHVFERTTGYYLPLRVGAAIAYSEGVFQLANNMAEVKPTLMISVPRVYESIQEKIEETVAKAPEKKQKIFHKAIEVGKAVAEQKRSDSGLVSPLLLLQRAVFDKLVYSKLRDRFGGNIRFLVSGAAALRPETAHFFEAIGITIIEGYGMTEAAPVISANPNRKPKVGTVGIVMPGGEVKIAPDGEILYRGPNVMKGYWNNEQATREMIDSEGWLHTGDVGILDDEGYVKITDRKKDIIVLASGKNVAPQPIEEAVKASPLISELVLIGDKQSTISALVIPNKEKLRAWATAENLPFADDDDALLGSAEAKRKIKQEIDAHSKHLADFEKIKRFALLNASFSVDSGELTPTLKVKRKVVMQKYAREIAEMRGGEGAGKESAAEAVAA